MLTDIVAILLLGITGVIALIFTLLLLKSYFSEKDLHHLIWAVSFFTLFASGVLIIIFGFEVLSAPLVPVVAALIPIGLAVGALHGIWDEKPYWLYSAIYFGILLVILLIVKLIPDFSNYSSMAIMAIHIPAGLIIVLAPLIGFFTEEIEISALLYSLAGLLISTGGALLAMAQLPSPPMGLTLEFVFSVLPLLLLVVSIFFVLGIVIPDKWSIDLPLYK